MSWTTKEIPSQAGKLAIVTGANSGIGYETALELARAGAGVIVAGRSEGKGKAAIAAIKTAVPGAEIRFEALDLASLASVGQFAERQAAANRPIDILVNNAGLMMLPKRQITTDGFEMQLGTNYLGHFALTGRLLPLLARARVVQLSSIAHRGGRIALGDLQSARDYRPGAAYGQSKLAMLMFALELQRRGEAAGWGLASVAAHPGIARSELVRNGMGAGLKGSVTGVVIGLIAQSRAAGALPTLYAATAPGVRPGGYYGPQGFQELRGPPGEARISPQALDTEVAAQLWDESERLTGVRYGR